MRGSDINESIIRMKLPDPGEPLTSTSMRWHAEKRYWHGKEILPYCEDRCKHGFYTQVSEYVDRIDRPG